MKQFSLLRQQLSETVTEIGDWKFIETNHSKEREKTRTGLSFSDIRSIYGRIHKKLNGLRIGDYMFTSKEYNFSIVTHIDPTKRQVRILTILPFGKHSPKPGTQKILMEENIISID